MRWQTLIRDRLSESVSVKEQVLASSELIHAVEQAAEWLVEAFRAGRSVYFCGNGGSAADAQHLAAELSGRYLRERPPLPAYALHVNTSELTAIANDYGYEEVFARVLAARGKEDDVLVAISTSGNSPNVLRAVEQAHALGMHTIALTGTPGGRLAQMAQLVIRVPSSSTPRIQEAHITIGHILCEIVETVLFP